MTTDAYFAINSLTGVIELAKEVDYDILPTGDKTYQIKVYAIDGGTPAETVGSFFTIHGYKHVNYIDIYKAKL